MTTPPSKPGRILLAEAPPPPDTVARGYAALDLRAHLESSDYRTSPVPLGGHDDKVRVERWASDPAVAEVRAEGEVVSISGSHEATANDTYVLDGRREPSELCFEIDGRRYALELALGNVRLFELRPRSADFPDVEEPAPLKVAPFDPREWIGDDDIEPWLDAHVRELLAGNDAMATVVAAGALLRLWSPQSAEGRAALSHRLRNGAADIVDRARAWSSRVDRWDEIEDAALLRAAALHEQLERLEEAGGTAALAALAVRERDQLESAAALLLAIDRGRELSAALAALDREAELHLSALAAWSGAGADPHLDAVSWREPDAWWGRLAD